jgi:regulator of ribonuclease activity A
MTLSTCDISDKLHPNVQYLAPIYKSYGLKKSFSGRIVTVKCFEDNSLVEQALNTHGKGSVLVIDAGGSMNCAMLGDKRASDAIRNGWEGIIIYGLIRDSVAINLMPIGIRALGVCPLKSVKKGIGKRNINVSFSNVYIYADEDGVIVTENKAN